MMCVRSARMCVFMMAENECEFVEWSANWEGSSYTHSHIYKYGIYIENTLILFW